MFLKVQDKGQTLHLNLDRAEIIRLEKVDPEKNKDMVEFDFIIWVYYDPKGAVVKAGLNESQIDNVRKYLCDNDI